MNRVWTRSWQVGTALTTGTAQALSNARVEVNNQLSGSTSAESSVKQLFLDAVVHSIRLWRRDAYIVMISHINKGDRAVDDGWVVR